MKNILVYFIFIIKNIISRVSNNTLNRYIPSTIGIPIIDIPKIHIIMVFIRLFESDLIKILRVDILLVLMVFLRVIILLVISSFIDLSNTADRYILINTISTVIIINIFSSLFFFILSPTKIYS